MPISVAFAADAQRALESGSILSTYANIGSELAHQSRMVMIMNATDALLQFSFDGGITDHFVIPATTSIILDITSNQEQIAGYWLSQGTQFAVKRIGTPTTGSVYLSVFYGKGE